MKKLILSILLGIVSVFNLSAQEIKTEFYDPSGTTITECDCKGTGDKTYQIHLWLPQSAFLYDQVTFHFNQENYPDFFSPRSFSGKQLQAQSSGKGYITLDLYPCGSYDKKDFTLSIKVTGSMITSYKEELQNNAIVKTPIYGNPDKIGTSASILVHVDVASAKKKMKGMWVLSGIVCGGLLVLYLLANPN